MPEYVTMRGKVIDIGKIVKNTEEKKKKDYVIARKREVVSIVGFKQKNFVDEKKKLKYEMPFSIREKKGEENARTKTKSKRNDSSSEE